MLPQILSPLGRKNFGYRHMLYEIFRHYMKNNTRLTTKRPKPQTEVDQYVLNFLGDSAINVPEDLVVLKDKILDSLEARPYNTETKEHADSIQWARTASEILQDKYIYQGKACSDIAIVFLASMSSVWYGRSLS